jgi:ribosomal protein S8
MKKFNEIDGITDIEVKTDFCELRIALYNTRGVIRKYLYAYAFPSLANKFIEDLTAEANKVKQVKALDKIKETQETIITKIQHLIKTLQEYLQSFTWDTSSVSAIETSAKYQVRVFLNNKDENKLTIENCIEMLQRNRLIYDSLRQAEKALGVRIESKSFMRLQTDIKTELQQLINAYDFV